jgi:glycosyltransferase involved in cell wall biosynthesis
MMKSKKRGAWILYAATYPPRECGIATFTRDLVTAVDKKFSPRIKPKILALNNDVSSIYNYPEDVIFQIDDADIQEYIDVAKKVNKTNAVKLVNIQHEFGIFGGEHGSYLIPFLETLEKPVVTALHTVLPNPREKMKRMMQLIAEKSVSMVVMTNTGVEILQKIYGITKTPIHVIPHGIPTVPFTTSMKEKTKLGFKNKTILSSFGMMNPGKGYEYVIDGLPEVVEEFPDLLYLIIGETHPVVRKKEGERYRNFLEKKVKKLGLINHVKFYNKYIRLSEIVKYLQATDLYISSATNPHQIVSGTLSYAMGCGRAVISTPFLHAKEIVTPDRGLLVEFSNPKSFTNAIKHMLSNPSMKEKMDYNAYYHTRHMTWPNVALSYMHVFENYLRVSDRYENNFPRVKLDHVVRLTDGFGITQFADNIKPDRNSGYTLDDNARVLLVSCKYHGIFNSNPAFKSIKRYLNFIKHIQHRDGRFYNFVGKDRVVDRSRWSEDSHGRALWALGYLISMEDMPPNVKRKAERLFNKGLKWVEDINSPRAIAFVLPGLYYYNKVKSTPDTLKIIRGMSDRLVELYANHSSEDWRWFEDYLTYANSMLPQSLFYSYLATGDDRYLHVAEDSLDFLSSLTFEKGSFKPIGQNGWYVRDGQRAHFDQQPIDTSSMVQTLVLAYKVTKKQKYRRKAFIAFNWFLGNNSLEQVVYDETTGGCHDGLGDSVINLNQGAESTIVYLLARLSLIDKKP